MHTKESLQKDSTTIRSNLSGKNILDVQKDGIRDHPISVVIEEQEHLLTHSLDEFPPPPPEHV